MKKKELIRYINLCQDLVNIFTDYSYSLDEYFKDSQTKLDHCDLYNEYIVLNTNLKKSMVENGFGDK